MCVSKNEIAHMVSHDTGIAQDKTRQVIDAFLNVLAKELRNHNEVRLIGFGSFDVREGKPRQVRNFTTGEVSRSEGFSRPAFKPSMRLKTIVNARKTSLKA